VKIIHVITTIDRGGAEKHLLTLAREQIRNGKEVTVVYLKGNGELISEFEAVGVRVDTTLANKSVFYKLFRLQSMMRNTFDVVHAHLPEAELLTSLILLSVPLVISRHNSERFYPKNRLISRALSIIVAIRARSCIAISDAVKTFLLESREWTDTANLSVVHYGIDCASAAKTARLTNSKITKFLTIGRLVPQKSIPILLESFALHIFKFSNDKLIIVGDGLQANTYKDFAERLGIAKHVSWIGRVKNVEEFYQSCDVFVLASKYEGFGLVLLEAMCEQIAILGSNVSSIPEVLGSNHPGLFESENVHDLSRLMELSKNLEFRKEIILCQNSRLQEFQPSSMEKKIDQVYRSLAEIS
jgi:glycosyltransferase involved in cell wall biosynthesis